MEDSLLSHLRHLNRYLQPHKKVLFLSFWLSVFSTALGLVQPFFAKVLIDNVFLGKNVQLLLPLLLGLIFLLIISFVVRMGNSFLYTSYSARLLFKMREDLFEHVQRAPLTFFAKTKIGDIYSRIASDMADVQGLITETIPHYFFNILTCIITAMILLWLHWKMTLMSFCFLPVALFVVRKIRPKLLVLTKNVAESNADIAHFLFESLSGTSLVRAFGAEKVECERLKEKQSSVLKFLLHHQTLKVFSGSVPTVIAILNTLIVFGYGGFLVITGALSVGSLVAFSIYQGRVFAPLQGLMDGFLAMQKSKVALQRVRDIFKIEPTFTGSGNVILANENLKGDIAFENVSFAYEKGEPVLNNLCFHIPAGKITALVGPSGAGKSTVCHMILRLFDPECGRITLDGIDLKRFKIDWLRKQVTLVAQDTFLFHTTIRENIRFSKPHVTDGEIIEAAKVAGIHDFIQSLPREYDTVVGDRGVRLSGGQKQRISIARSLLWEPKILILDEATAFLDSLAEERIKTTIRLLMKGRTLLVVSHRASAIQDADIIIALEKEGLAYQGPFADFPFNGKKVLENVVSGSHWSSSKSPSLD